jgi:sugar phosphate isomerase/epimerase
MQLGLETFSYLPWFMAGRMDVFGFVRRAKELGLDGVQLNIGVPQDGWGMLGGDDPARLQALRALCDELGLFVEVDTRTYDPDTLTRALEITAALGADTLRTYVSFPDDLRGDALRDYMAPGGGLDHDLQASVPVLRNLLSLCERLGVRLALENHEYETAAQVIDLVRALDSAWVGILIDTGNMMNVWEDPVAAVAAMAPWAVSTHVKDAVVMLDGNEPMVAGVPLGRGSIDLPACCRLFATASPLTRLCIEVCYGYRAGFRVPEGRGGGGRLGEGAFRVLPPPYDPSLVAPYPNYQHPAHLSPADGEQFLRWVDDAVAESVRYMQTLTRAEHPS